MSEVSASLTCCLLVSLRYSGPSSGGVARVSPTSTSPTMCSPRSARVRRCPSPWRGSSSSPPRWHSSISTCLGHDYQPRPSSKWSVSRLSSVQPVNYGSSVCYLYLTSRPVSNCPKLSIETVSRDCFRML